MKVLVDVSGRYPRTGIGRYSEFLTKSLSNAPNIYILKLVRSNLIVQSIQDVSLIFLSLFKDIIFPEERFLYVALLCLKKQTIVIHDTRWLQQKDLKSRVINFGFRAALRKGWVFIAASPVVSNELHGIDSEIYDLFNCVNPVNNIKLTDEDKIWEGHFLLLYVGSFEPRKNIGRLLRLVERCNACELTIVCSKFYWDRRKLTTGIDEMIQSLGQRVQIKIDVSDSELNKIYLSSDAYISLSEYEGFGRPLIEAQSLGLPIIALGLPQTTLVLGDGFFDMQSYSELDSAISRLICNYSRYQFVGLENSKRYSSARFDITSRGIFL
jgi:glycosyltransferase involved in cell wall biosynthesis